jgi:hypothetical protein
MIDYLPFFVSDLAGSQVPTKIAGQGIDRLIEYSLDRII